jgi:hypothetical protein
MEVAAVKSPPLPDSLYSIKLSAKEPTSVLRTFQIQVNETLHHLNFEILEPSDEPVLKGVNDPI